MPSDIEFEIHSKQKNIHNWSQGNIADVCVGFSLFVRVWLRQNDFPKLRLDYFRSVYINFHLIFLFTTISEKMRQYSHKRDIFTVQHLVIMKANVKMIFRRIFMSRFGMKKNWRKSRDNKIFRCMQKHIYAYYAHQISLYGMRLGRGANQYWTASQSFEILHFCTI